MTDTATALDGLDLLRLAVSHAKQRVQELDLARRDGARRVEEHSTELLDYHRAVGELTREEDPAIEATLRANLLEAQEGLVTEADVLPYGNGNTDVQLRWTDPAAEARYDGAVSAQEQAEGSLREFIGRNLPALAAERAGMARAITDRANAAMEEVRGAASQWESERTWWAQLLVQGGQDHLVGQVPMNPLHLVQEMPLEAVPPMPEAFWPAPGNGV